MTEALPQRPARKWGLPIGRLLLSLIVLTLLVTWFPVSELREAVSRVPFRVWMFCFVAFLAGHLVGSFKWSLLIGGGNNRLPFHSVAYYYFAGLFANLFLPTIAGGDVVRAGLAMRGAKSKQAVLVGSVLDRLLDTCALVVLTVAGGLSAGATLSGEDGRRLLVLGVVMLGVGIAGGAFLLTSTPSWLPEKLRGFVAKVRDAVFHLIRNPAPALGAFSLALIIQSGFVLLNALLGSACGIDVPIAVWFLSWPLAKLSGLLPVTLGGLGVREASLAAVLSRFGVAVPRSVGLGLLWDTIVIGGGAFGGLFYAVSRRAGTGDEDSSG